MPQMHKPHDAHSTANQCPRREKAFDSPVRVPTVRFVDCRCETPPGHRLAVIISTESHTACSHGLLLQRIRQGNGVKAWGCRSNRLWGRPNYAYYVPNSTAFRS